MELILWRHAEAEAAAPGQADMERALTSKGRRQARLMAGWLDSHLPANCRIIASPARRTLQTAEALRRRFKTHSSLAPDASATDILEAAHWPDNREAVLVIGHQPALGRVAALLIAGQEQDWALRKGGICWIAQKANGNIRQNHVKALLGPDFTSR